MEGLRNVPNKSDGSTYHIKTVGLMAHRQSSRCFAFWKETWEEFCIRSESYSVLTRMKCLSVLNIYMSP